MTDQSNFDAETSEHRYQLLVNAVSNYAMIETDSAG